MMQIKSKATVTRVKVNTAACNHAYGQAGAREGAAAQHPTPPNQGSNCQSPTPPENIHAQHPPYYDLFR